MVLTNKNAFNKPMVYSGPRWAYWLALSNLAVTSLHLLQIDLFIILEDRTKRASLKKIKNKLTLMKVHRTSARTNTNQEWWGRPVMPELGR